jgi:PKD repeat protein
MAKYVRLYCCLAAVFLFQSVFFQLGAQSFTATVEQHISHTLNQQFSNYEVFRLDAKLLDAQVKSNVESEAELKIGLHNWRLHLTLNPIVSPNYSVQVGGPQGVTTTYPKRDIAFKGYEVHGGGKVRLTINGEFLYGFVEEGNIRYYVEPLWYFEPMAERDLFVLYPESAVVPFAPDFCGVTEAEIELQKLEDAAKDKVEQGAENGACYELEVAVASDESMLSKYGSVSAVEDHNIGVLNDVEGDYTGNFNHDLDFIIVTQFVSSNDPWTNSTDAGALLGSFRTWGNNGGFGVNFDVGELWTNRNFNGSTIGIAYLNGICNSNKYHCLQDFTGNASLLRVLTSHELGHNFSSGHDANCPPPDFIMCPSVSGATEWSGQSSDAINNYMQGRINNGCLSTCGPPPPPLVADFVWDPNPGCQGEAVNFTDLSSGNINTWSWTFQGGNPASSNQQNPSVTWNTPGTKNITLTINGVGGANSLTQTIEILPLPTANFNFAVNGLEVTFDNTSTNATSYEWDFGDGFASFEENPIHEYIDAGTYVVELKAYNDCGVATHTRVVNTAPIADFTGSPTTGCATLVVALENLSSSNATAFQWTCPGGIPANSNQANPSISYNSAGTYSITLKATNASGSHTFTRTDYITVGAVPVANFTSVVNGATATFTNTTFGNASSYLWDFGDSDTSTLANPSHTYAAPGTYTVVLTAINDCGTSTKSGEVVIVASAPPTAAFTANPSSGCAPLTVNFANNSTGAVSYIWDFPGGTPNTSTETNPTVVYNTAGTYTVTLTATNANGSNTSTGTITVNTLPTASFTQAISNDTTVSFTNTSVGGTSYLWTFGDGDSSVLVNPVHHYAALDTTISYQVILFSTNACGTISDTQSVTIVTDPKANFTATPTSGCGPLTVQYNNTSSPNAVSFQWDFPGGDPSTSTQTNPVVVYATAGAYSATLIAINPSGRDTISRSNYITVNTLPTSAFTSAANGLTVTFTNTSSGATSYSWDFGDNGNSAEANPSHTYAADGTYTVILSATNACGTATSSQTVTVTTAPTAGFTATPNSGCAPLTVVFTNTSSSNATSYNWQFPGGTPSSSTAQNPPSVEYNLPGNYTVTLTVSNASGSSTFTQNIVVSAGPMANFSASVSVLTATFTNLSTNAIAYSWDFGDDEQSNAPNPTHTYAADGTYTVVLTASNDCGTSTFTQNVVITTEPDAGFSVSTSSGCAVLTTTFTDISSGDPVSWAWEFPGGTPNTSSAENPTVQYSAPGVYDVTLVVTSAGGSTSSFTQSNLITVNAAPTVGFLSSMNGATAIFTNTSTDATNYSWNFGDNGGASGEENPTHTYQNDGAYNVTLTATNTCGTGIFEQTITVVTLPTAGFNSNNLAGCEPLTVAFTNTSSSNATTFQWDFPGGDPSSSSDENPMVTWNTAGVYTVTLTVSNAAGSSTSTSTITVNAAPTAAFAYAASALTVTFTNNSSNGTSYLWDFGDGTTGSTEANPTHTYSAPGTYPVTLTTTNECGTVTVTQSVVLVTGTGEANWVEGFRLFPNPNPGIFTVEMSGLPKDEVEFVLFNALGQQIKREVVDFGTGTLLRSFDYGVLPAGFYTLRVQADGQAMFAKVTVGK